MEHKELAPKLVETAAEMSGGVIGAAVGVCLAGPAGAIAGGAVGPLIAKCLSALGQEVHSRMLGPREVQRIDQTLRIAAKMITDRTAQGETLRNDGFFESENGNRSAGEEVGEGVLRAAQKECEERKIPYLAALIASVSFESTVGREQANMLIRLIERLSFRQLRLLSFLGRLDELQVPRVDDSHLEPRPNSQLAWDIEAELDELISANLLKPVAGTYDMLICFHVHSYLLADAGKALFRLAALNTMPLTDLKDFRDFCDRLCKP